MEDAAVLEEQQETTETEPKQKRKRGRPPKQLTDEDRAAKKSAENISGPRYLKYNSDSPNKNQKTSAAWAWADGVPASMKEIADLTVYRDWPVTLAPLDDADAKSIDKLLGSDANFIRHDQDLVDRYGAGEYQCYYNINPPGAQRRLMFTAYVKCTHDFRDFPPTDRRIDDVAKVDLNDKSNGSYVAWLRATGKLKDEDRESKEKEEMAATSGVMAELVKDMAQDRRELTQKLLEKTEQDREIPPDPPPSPQDVISEQLSIFKSLKELVPTSDPLEMVKQVVGMAQVLVQQKAPSEDLKPLMEEISKLREESRAVEREMWRTQFADLKEQIRVAKETPPASNVVLPDGSNLDALIQRAVEKLVDKPEENPWIDIVKTALPSLTPIATFLIQRMLTPTPQAAPFPQPPPNYQAGAAQPQQAQLPAPTPAQPGPQLVQQQPQPAQQVPQDATPDQMLVIQILNAIANPEHRVSVIGALANGDGGDDFAADFIPEHGQRGYRLIAAFSPEQITDTLYQYPVTAPLMAQFPRDKVLKFAEEFRTFDPIAYDKKMEKA